MTRRGKIALSVVGLLLLGITYVIYSIHRLLNHTVPDAYAVWNTASVVVDHLDHNDGAWPASWDELRASHKRLYGQDAASFETLRSRVDIDFRADPEVLSKAPEPTGDEKPFRVIWAKSGSQAYYTEPNRLVWSYLKQRTATRPYQTPANEPKSR